MFKVLLLLAVEFGIFKGDRRVYFQMRLNRLQEELNFLHRRKRSLACDLVQMDQIECLKLRAMFNNEILKEVSKITKREREVHLQLLSHLRHLPKNEGTLQ